MEKTSRFHFRLADLILTVVLISAQLAVCQSFLPMMETTEIIETMAAVLAITLVAVCFAVFEISKRSEHFLFRLIAFAALFLPLAPISYGIAHAQSGRHIKRNESAAGAACQSFAAAEDLYIRTDFDKDGVLEYAQTLRELYETKPGLADVKLIAKEIADAEEGPGATPFKGYFFKVLYQQGSNATGGSRFYVDQKGNMTLGYALIAYPANYKKTAIRTFIISNAGTIFEADQGPDSTLLGRKTDTFDLTPEILEALAKSCCE